MAETVLETLSKKEIIFFGLALFVGLSAFFAIGGTKGIFIKINFGYTFCKTSDRNFEWKHDYACFIEAKLIVLLFV